RRSIQREGAVRKFLYEEIGIGTELGAVAELVRLIDVLVDVEGPQQHIDTIADLARQAKFLRESPDVQVLEIRVNEVSAREVRILRGDRVGLAKRSDRGEGKTVGEVDVDLAGKTVVFDIVCRVEVAVDNIVEAIGRQIDLPAERADCRCGEAVLEVDDGAAVFVDRVVVADYPQPEAVTRIDQSLAANEPAVALVGAVPGAEIAEEAVAFVEAGSEAEGQGISNRTGDVTLENQLIEIAVGCFSRAAEFELGLLRRDRDHAGRGIL